MGMAFRLLWAVFPKTLNGFWWKLQNTTISRVWPHMQINVALWQRGWSWRTQHVTCLWFLGRPFYIIFEMTLITQQCTIFPCKDAPLRHCFKLHHTKRVMSPPQKKPFWSKTCHHHFWAGEWTPLHKHNPPLGVLIIVPPDTKSCWRHWSPLLKIKLRQWVRVSIFKPNIQHIKSCILGSQFKPILTEDKDDQILFVGFFVDPHKHATHPRLSTAAVSKKSDKSLRLSNGSGVTMHTTLPTLVCHPIHFDDIFT